MSTSEESLLKFPCQFPIKIMGKKEDNFDAVVVEIIRRHIPERQDFIVKSRLSRNARYMSVTVTINATSKAQLDNIYMDLTAHEKVIMAL